MNKEEAIKIIVILMNAGRYTRELCIEFVEDFQFKELTEEMFKEKFKEELFQEETK